MKYLILLFTPFIVSTTYAQSKVPTPIPQTSITAEKHTTEITIEEDLTETTIETMVLKANDDEGRTILSTYPMMYDGTNTEIKVLEASSFHNGLEKKLDLTTLKTVDVPLNVPGTASLKLLQFPFSGLSTGDSISIKTVKKSKEAAITGIYNLDLNFGFLVFEKQMELTIKSAVRLYSNGGGYDPTKMTLKQTIPREPPYIYSYTLREPLLAVSKFDLMSKSQADLLSKMARVNLSSSSDWKTWSLKSRKYYEISSAELESKEFKSVLKSIAIDEKDPIKTIENFQLWTAENITYSARWMNKKSGWAPRSLQEIVSSRVGDCKDFAKLFLAFATVAKIEAQPVLTYLKSGIPTVDIMAEPLPYGKPLPMTRYFNHAVVQYKHNGKWTVLDPGRNIIDARRTPYFLNNSWAVSLVDGNPMERIKVGGPDYSLVKINSSFDPMPDKNLFASSKAIVSGEMANYFRTIYFSEGEKQFKDALQFLAMSPRSKNFDYKSISPITRKSDPIEFEVTYIVPPRTGEGEDNNKDAEKDAQVKITSYDYDLYPMHPSAMTYKAYDLKMMSPSFPGEFVQDSTFSKMFAPNEVEKDCFVKGPLSSIVRSVVNTNEGVTVTDRASVTQLYQPEFNGTEIGKKMQSNDSGIFHCLSKKLALESKSDSKNQKSFEASINLKAPISKFDLSKDGIYHMQRLREINYRLKADNTNAALWKEHAQHIRRLGYYSGIKIDEHLLEALQSLEIAHKHDTKNAGILAQIAHIHLELGNLAKSKEYFKQGYNLNNRDVELLYIGGRIYEKEKKFELAEKYYISATKQSDPTNYKMAPLQQLASMYCGEYSRCEKSLPIHDQIIALNPADGSAYHRAAVQYNKHGFFVKAEEFIRKSIKLSNFRDSRTLLSEILTARAYPLMGPKDRVATLDELKKAEDLLKEAYSLNKYSGYTLYCLSLLYLDRSLRSKSVDDIRMGRNYYQELQKYPYDWYLKNGDHLNGLYKFSEKWETQVKVILENQKRAEERRAATQSPTPERKPAQGN